MKATYPLFPEEDSAGGRHVGRAERGVLPAQRSGPAAPERRGWARPAARRRGRHVCGEPCGPPRPLPSGATVPSTERRWGQNRSFRPESPQAGVRFCPFDVAAGSGDRGARSVSLSARVSLQAGGLGGRSKGVNRGAAETADPDAAWRANGASSGRRGCPWGASPVRVTPRPHSGLWW